MSFSSSFLKPILSPFSKGKLSILIYHRVHAQSDPIFPAEVDAKQFSLQLAWIKSLFNVIPLDEAVEALSKDQLPARAASITFDDGYADNAEVALPVLKQHALNATFFICTGYLDGGRMWNDTIIESVRRARGTVLDLTALTFGKHSISDMRERRSTIFNLIRQLKYLPLETRQEKVDQIKNAIGQALPDNLMLRSEQVREMHMTGMTIGAHTVTHPILARIDGNKARQEIKDGKEKLQAILDKPVSLFAYPNGKPGEDYLPEHVKIVKELGFKAAVSTAWGTSSKTSDIFQLSRFTPWDQTQLRFSLRLIKNCISS